MVSISAHQTLDGKVQIEGRYQPSENEIRSIHWLIERMTSLSVISIDSLGLNHLNSRYLINHGTASGTESPTR
jgi:hypothetical protein